MHWMVCSVCYLGCMVVNINAPFAEWRITERNYFQILLPGILSGIEPIFLFSDIDAVTASYFLCFGKYTFPQLLLIALTALGNLIYQAISNNFLVFNFKRFFNFKQFPFPLDKWLAIPYSFSMLYSTIN